MFGGGRGDRRSPLVAPAAPLRLAPAAGAPGGHLGVGVGEGVGGGRVAAVGGVGRVARVQRGAFPRTLETVATGVGGTIWCRCHGDFDL